jgi:type IV pilus assembly protein PilA
MTEAFNLGGGQNGAVSEYHSTWGKWPADNTAAGIAQPLSITGKYVSQVTVNNGSIEALIKGAGSAAKGIQGKTLYLGVTATGGSYSWTCRSSAEPKFLPASCRP